MLPVKRDVRRAFQRAARTYDEAAVLQREVCTRLLEHLDPIRLVPQRAVDLGCGTGQAFDALAKRFPGATIVGLDLAPAMLARARERSPWWQRVLGSPRPALVCADAERLPLANASVDLAFSNLALQWCEPSRVFAEAARVLGAEGLFLFSTFGPDTLRELRAAFAEADVAPHVNRFIDMHDLGDALVDAGFADPVMEMETITLEYDTVLAIARDLKAIGAVNSLPSRSRGLPGRNRWRRMTQAYEQFRRNGVLPATWEVIYGHAWKVPPKRLADGRQVVSFAPKAPR
ncbi:MAG TPA: malonyl-ACP O-methyltransferase BioC [Usitatibacteraceae bacterium]|nr:malonyl-ACP O-methyltransferase BioC [Usitatibacteraceae bacterium]